MSIILPEEYLTVMLIAVGLAMDCFAVSMSKGLATKRARAKNAAVMASFFGIFQAGMPVLGYSAGRYLIDMISSYAHWIAFGLLGMVGSKMLRGAICREEKGSGGSVGLHELLVLSVATSIDALAVGLTFAFLEMPIILAAVIIGLVSFLFSLCGFFLGGKAGERFGGYAEIAGGLVLIGIGTRILLTHTGFV